MPAAASPLSRLPRLGDALALAASLAATAAFTWLLMAQSGAADSIRVESPAGVYAYPLDQERRVAVSGPLGETVLRVEHGEVWVESSPCANQLCRHMGHIRNGGSWLACLPNAVFVRIGGAESEALDATTW